MLMERKNLQFGREVNLADLNAITDVQHDRSEVQNACHPRRDNAVADVLGSRRRCRDDGDRRFGFFDDPFEFVKVADPNARCQRNIRANQSRVSVE